MTTDPVDDYLDELADASRLRGRRLRHLLAEVEDHLTTSRAEHRAAGLPDAEAGRRAIDDFGPPAEVAAALDRAAAPPAVAVLREAAPNRVQLGAVGQQAIGLSGLLAAAGGAALGKAFVSGDGPGVTYSATRCADLQEYHPSPTCEQAATGHHYDEVVGYRLAAGVLGLVVLGGWLAVVRPWRRGPSPAVLPPSFGPVVGATVFGAAAVVLLPTGVAEVALSGTDAGAGNALSAGVVAVGVFLGCAVLLWRDLRAHPA